MMETDLTKDLGETMIAKRDRLVLEAVEIHLGRKLPEAIETMILNEKALMSLLAGRLFASRFPDGREVWAMDGVALIEFYPPQFSTGARGQACHLTATQSYRVLVTPAETQA